MEGSGEMVTSNVVGRQFGRWSLFIGLTMMMSCPGLLLAQTTIYSTGFESPFITGNLSGQQTWTALPASGAGTVVTSTVFAGTQSVRINGPSLSVAGFGASGTSYWVKTLAPNLAASFKPVAAGQPIVIVDWRQFITGSTNDTSNMPNNGIHIEGYRADGQTQITTQVVADFTDSVSVFDGASYTAGPVIPGLRNSWVNITARLDYNTQLLDVLINGNPYLSELPFANYNPALSPAISVGLAESDLIATNGALFGLLQANNQVFFDNLSLTAIAVPEPTTLALALAGAGGVGYWAWRRRRAWKRDAEQLVEQE
jgi:hypothetical protein